MRLIVGAMLAAGTIFVGRPFPVAAQAILNQLEARMRGAAPAGQGQEPGYLGMMADDRQENNAGVRILDVMPGGPADMGGLKTGDLITALDGKPVRSMDDFARFVTERVAGNRLSVQVQRDGKPTVLDVTLGRRPVMPPMNPGNSINPGNPGPMPTAEPRGGSLGVRLASVTPDMQQRLQLPAPAGALVVGIVQGSNAAKAGIPLEAVIVSIDGHGVQTPSDAARLVAAAGTGHEIAVSYYLQGMLHERLVMLEAAAPLPPPLISAEPLPAAEPQRVDALERRVAELERRVAELEQALRVPAAKP